MPPPFLNVLVMKDELGDGPPLVDELAWRHLLERHFDGGAHRRPVGRGARVGPGCVV